MSASNAGRRPAQLLVEIARGGVVIPNFFAGVGVQTNDQNAFVALRHREKAVADDGERAKAIASGIFQSTFGGVVFQSVLMPLSGALPLPFGPRNRGHQSLGSLEFWLCLTGVSGLYA